MSILGWRWSSNHQKGQRWICPWPLSKAASVQQKLRWETTRINSITAPRKYSISSARDSILVRCYSAWKDSLLVDREEVDSGRLVLVRFIEVYTCRACQMYCQLKRQEFPPALYPYPVGVLLSLVWVCVILKKRRFTLWQRSHVSYQISADSILGKTAWTSRALESLHASKSHQWSEKRE